jgi:hypothetical protein
MTHITHHAIAEQEQTCLACPEQYQGTLVDGRTFYFRYRHGWATLGLGHDLDSAVLDPEGVGREVGDDLDGQFASPEIRDSVFAILLAERFGQLVEYVAAAQLGVEQLAQLRTQVSAAVLAGDPFAGSQRRAIAATLRWAAEQPQHGRDGSARLRLKGWADQIEAAQPAGHKHSAVRTAAAALSQPPAIVEPPAGGAR